MLCIRQMQFFGKFFSPMCARVCGCVSVGGRGHVHTNRFLFQIKMCNNKVLKHVHIYAKDSNYGFFQLNISRHK